MKYEKIKSAAIKTARRRTKQQFDPKTGLWHWNVKNFHPKELKYRGIDQPPNADIITALSTLLNETLLLIPPVGVRYLITMDMREHMYKGRHFCKSRTSKHGDQNNDHVQQTSTSSDNGNPDERGKKRVFAECFYYNNVIPGRAAVTIASHILKREREVMIAVFTDEGIHTSALDRNLGFPEIENILINAMNGKVQLDAPIKWAMETNTKIDIFINMVDRPTRYMELGKKARVGRGPGGRYGPPPKSPSLEDHCPARALEKYRLQCNQPNSKLIVMSLASQRICTTDNNHSGILDIIGIDKYVPEVMDAFAKGKFN
ncbi:hypothetical protein EVAR_24938_1 [Eumeta japonica]|uniref:RNA-binding protein RO60 vWA domain-containing protein n=1 Tax=Eumeta variegata TaxID=151549 RepID=A0A4C2A2I0_EUMVA|nr:hypothetical protein EVAR_24938_1 [Eumeta japonica]